VEVHIAVGGHDVERSIVFVGELEHVIGRIPASSHVTRHHAQCEREGFKNWDNNKLQINTLNIQVYGFKGK